MRNFCCFNESFCILSASPYFFSGIFLQFNPIWQLTMQQPLIRSSALPMGRGGELKKNKVQLMGWDSLTGQKREIIIIIMVIIIAIIIKHYNINNKIIRIYKKVLLLTAHRSMPSQFLSSPCPALPPCLYTGHHVIWYRITLWSAGVRCPGCIPS